MNEHETTALLNRLADDCPVSPPPVQTVVAGGERRARDRRRAGVAIAALTVVGIAAGTSLALGGLPVNNDTGPTPAAGPTAPPGWEHLTGPALADAVGLTPVPLADVDQTPACDGAVVVEFTNHPTDLTYCYVPSDLGVTDPVEAQLLTWQLWGFPRSPDLVELASLQVELHRAVPGGGDGGASVDRIRQLKHLIDELRQRLFPPNGQAFQWLHSQNND